jgi:acyl-CoA dehydrogenase
MISQLRRSLLIKPFLRWFQRENPPLSDQEQQVIDAGGVWWGTELFSGHPDWQTLLSGAAPTLTATEQAFLDQSVTQLCDVLDEWQISYRDHDLSPEAWHLIKTHRFWALEMETQYGGHGFSPLAHAAIISKIAARSISAAITVMVPNSLGPAEFLKYYGSPAQKQYYLPRLACGEEIACFALTGIEAGSDAASICDTGVVCRGMYEGETVIGVRLNWNKRYITLAPVATLIGLAFRLFDPQHLLGEMEDIGITLALIPSHLPGIEKGARHVPLNMGFMNGPLQGKDVFIPLDQLIGGVERRGQGWQMMMECLVVGRGISLPSLATAMGQFCARMSSAYALVRRQFHRPIIKFEGIQQAVGRLGGLAYLSEALRLATITVIQQGGRPAVASAITKYHLTEFVRKMVADSMDIHGGHGIQLGPHNYLGALHDAAPINITVEGANILTRGLIIFGQGVLRCHPYLRDELAAAMSGNIDRFDQIFCRHLVFILTQLFRLPMYGFTGGRWIRTKVPAGLPRRYFRQLTRMSNAFIVLTDLTLLTLGKRLKMKEALSARLGDILSHLYMAVSVIQHYQHRGRPADETVLMEWGVAYCFHQIQTAMIDFLANFPVRWLGALLRRLIFPWGTAYSGPVDSLTAHIAQAFCSDTALRERLTSHCYLPKGSSAWQMEQAMHALLEAAPLLEKIQHVHSAPLPSPWESELSARIRSAYQQQKINQQERDQLQAVADLCWAVIQVDAF